MNTLPNLTEPGIKDFVTKSLRDYRIFQDNQTSILFNIIMISIFLFTLVSILYYRYKGHISPQEIKQKNLEKKEYIFTKLQSLAAIKKDIKSGMITNLPIFDTN